MRRGECATPSRGANRNSRAQNYYATHYVAEPVNAATNLLFLYLAGKGVHNCVRHAHDGIFLLTFCGCLVVGASSLAFHTTLTCTSCVSPAAERS